MEWLYGDFRTSTDPALLQIDVIHGFLVESYWARNIPKHIVEHSIKHSLNFGLYDARQQVAFARVITDYATFAYLADAFVLPEYRGRGLAKWLLECVTLHPQLQGLRRWALATLDAHGLYEQYGFTCLKRPEIFMERHDADIYQQ